MTTLAVPPAGSPAWREIYPTPPDVRLDIEAGRWCPLDDTTLKIRLDGYGCPACGAAWNFQGLSGRWLADPAAVVVAVPALRWRPSAVLVLAGVAGCAVLAAVLVLLLGVLGERLQWWPAVILAVAAAAVLAYPWVARKVDDWPYRHNRMIGPVDRDGGVTGER